MASVETISAVVQSVASTHSPAVSVSAALGEAREWTDCSAASGLDRRLAYVKLGLSGLGQGINAIDRWRTICGRIDALSQKAWPWIAVAYADWQLADCPSPEELIDAAAENCCVGVLFDTFGKDGCSLLDHLTSAKLRELVGRVQQGEMLSAIAGSLTIEHLPLLEDIPADVIAIRSAACYSADRTASIDAARVTTFHSALRSTYAV